MKIQVLGSGCPTCKKLNDMTVQAVKELGLKDDVEYLTGDKGTSKIIEMGIMSSPVLAIDEKPAMVGFVPDIEKIKKLLTNNTSVQECNSKEGDDCCGDDCECNSKPKEVKACNCGGKC